MKVRLGKVKEINNITGNSEEIILEYTNCDKKTESVTLGINDSIMFNNCQKKQISPDYKWTGRSFNILASCPPALFAKRCMDVGSNGISYHYWYLIK